jgi:hypothetical protein
VEDRKGEIALLILHFSAILYWRPERAQVWAWACDFCFILSKVWIKYERNGLLETLPPFLFTHLLNTHLLFQKKRIFIELFFDNKIVLERIPFIQSSLKCFCFIPNWKYLQNYQCDCIYSISCII